ncbi:phosphoribosyl-AMP cyclohydrolase [Spirochaeta dissipatitropha]
MEKDIDFIEEGLKPQLQFNKRGGLLPVIVQDVSDGRILMLGYANHEAFEYSLRERRACFFSTSRNRLWVKGETSGDYLSIEKILVDCDQDAIVYCVSRVGEGACHTRGANGKARVSCFYREVISDGSSLAFLEHEAGSTEI